jgi:hypothetical protein
LKKVYLDILQENITVLNLSAHWVRRSFEQTRAIEIKDIYTDEEFDKLEVLASRYARTTDMLINKVLRSIDTIEFEDTGTIIDVMNRTEKRGITSAGLLHTIKDLRNNIVHEYQINEIHRFFKDIIEYSPVLLEIIGKVNEYCMKYL